jgi:hypothetical protein
MIANTPVPLFPPVNPDQFGLSEEMTGHRFLDLGLHCAGIQGQRRVQGIQLEEIPVRPRRRAGPAVSLFPKIIRPLERP